MMSIKRNILLNPGPATTTDSVKYAQVVPDICPREKEFGAVMEFISKELTSFVADNEKYTTVLFGGAGTAAVEAMVSSTVGNGTLLVINNGAYGERIKQIANAYGMDLVEFVSSPVDAVDLDKLRQIIQDSKGRITHLAVVHHETTTGLLTNIREVGRICAEFSICMLVDAMSSYAAVPIDMQEMNISFLASSSNKNIQGMAGVSFVIANKQELIKTKDVKARNFYLNLYSQFEYFQKEYQMRFTPPVQTLYALKQAIIETREETIEKRYARYTKSWETLINGLERLELKYLVSKENHSRIITSIIEPDIKTYNMKEMHDFFYERGYTIYPGKLGTMNTFRIANIGAINYKDITGFLTLLEVYLKRINYI